MPSLSAEDLETRVMFPPTALRQEHTLGTALGQLVLESVAHGGADCLFAGVSSGDGVVQVGGILSLTLGESLSILRGGITVGLPQTIRRAVYGV